MIILFLNLITENVSKIVNPTDDDHLTGIKHVDDIVSSNLELHETELEVDQIKSCLGPTELNDAARKAYADNIFTM